MDDLQCCSKNLDIDFQIHDLDKPKTPTWTPSTMLDFQPFLSSDEDPWKQKASVNGKTILSRNNYDSKIAEIHEKMANSGIGKPSQDSFQPFLTSYRDPKVKATGKAHDQETRETPTKKRKTERKSTEEKKRVTGSEEKKMIIEQALIKNCKKGVKLRKKLRFSTRLTAYKQKKTLQKRTTLKNIFTNNLLPYLTILELQNKLLLAEVDKINIRLQNISFS